VKAILRLIIAGEEMSRFQRAICLSDEWEKSNENIGGPCSSNPYNTTQHCEIARKAQDNADNCMIK